jgi:hypothetical protein
MAISLVPTEATTTATTIATADEGGDQWDPNDGWAFVPTFHLLAKFFIEAAENAQYLKFDWPDHSDEPLPSYAFTMEATLKHTLYDHDFDAVTAKDTTRVLEALATLLTGHSEP